MYPSKKDIFYSLCTGWSAKVPSSRHSQTSRNRLFTRYKAGPLPQAYFTISLHLSPLIDVCVLQMAASEPSLFGLSSTGVVPGTEEPMASIVVIDDTTAAATIGSATMRPSRTRNGPAGATMTSRSRLLGDSTALEATGVLASTIRDNNAASMGPGSARGNNALLPRPPSSGSSHAAVSATGWTCSSYWKK